MPHIIVQCNLLRYAAACYLSVHIVLSAAAATCFPPGIIKSLIQTNRVSKTKDPLTWLRFDGGGGSSPLFAFAFLAVTKLCGKWRCLSAFRLWREDNILYLLSKYVRQEQNTFKFIYVAYVYYYGELPYYMGPTLTILI